MRFIFALLMILATLTFGLACQNAASSTKTVDENPVAKKAADKSAGEHDDDAPRISLADAKKAFDEGTAVFVDTRSADSFNNEHIRGAINVPAGDFEKTYKSIPKDKKIIAYCS